MTIESQIATHINHIHLECKTSLQRRLIVLSGAEDWCFNIANQLADSSYLAVSQNNKLSKMRMCSSDKLHFELGREYENIVWDGFSGLNPDSLGIASGLLKAGGLFVLLLPAFDYLSQHPDPDYTRMCSDTFSLHDCHTFFLQRLVKHLQHSSDVTIFEEATFHPDFRLRPNLTCDITADIPLPTPDQIEALKAIKRVAYGHRNRPLVIQAHRGRGKSSVLGIAAAEIYLEKNFKSVITAPSKKTCEAAFYHYKDRIQSALSSQPAIDKALSAFQFIPIDVLLTQEIDSHLLFIDEAAAIPTSYLNALLDRFSRIIYSTTIHGYEGNGQGFAIRFQKTLNNHFKSWKLIDLHTPIRWLAHDPLEAWFFRFLLLDTQLTQIVEASSEARQTEWVTQQALFENEALFEQVISLLVTAHYQTSPSDIRIILDHPKVNILITRNADSHSTNNIRLYGVCLVIEEGAIDSPELSDAIISGKRRPRGHLFPQALCASSADSRFLTQSTYRIMRIAVHPAMQHKGIGSNLLSSLKVRANENNIDSLSTSYGLSPELLAFWKKNSFTVVKIGTKVDGASGLQSVMMMYPLSSPADSLLTNYSTHFLKDFIFNLNRRYKYLSVETVYQVVQSLQTKAPLKNRYNTKKIHTFAYASRSFEDTHIELFEFVLESILSPQWHHLSRAEQEILITQVLQSRDYKSCLSHLKLDGKKQVATALRQAVISILDTKT